MKNFELLLPESLEQALDLLPEGEDWSAADTRVLAGGQDLLTEMKRHLVEPERLVNLKATGALGRLGVTASGNISIGALVTLARLPEFGALGGSHRVVAEAALSVASPQIRTQATVGGNLCQRPRCWYYRHEEALCLKKGGTECFAYEGLSKYNAVLGGGPSYIVHPSDLAPALIAADARIHLRASHGVRDMALEDFFTLPTEGDITRENVLAPGELVDRVELPARHRDWRSTYLKFREKSSFDFALASVALALRFEGETIAEARLCLGGVAPRPWRCTSTEALLIGREIDEETCVLASQDALRGAEPLADNGYKIPLTQGLITRALRALAEA